MSDEYGAEDEVQKKIRAFDERVKKASKVLLARKAGEDKRLKAAAWLGESGAPEAIEPLVKVYQKDPNRRIKKAAAYALGQFRALEEAIETEPGETVVDALAREENSHIFDLLSDITLEGKIGKRRGGISTGLLTRIMGLLVATLVVLGVLVVLQLTGSDEPAAPPTQVADAPEDEQALSALAAAEDAIDRVRQIAGVLQVDFDAAQADETNTLPNCNVNLTLPGEPISVTPAVAARYPDLPPLIEEVNLAVDSLGAAVRARDRVCELSRPVEPGEFRVVNAGITRATADLDQFTTQIQVLRTAITTGTAPEAAATELGPATATPEPSLTPTPTVSPELTEDYLVEMLNIVQEMTAARGPGGLLTQYWEDVVNTGQTDGCRDASPEIPTDVAPLPEDVTEAVPELERARQGVNLGLQLLRDGWARFDAACDSGSLVQEAQTGVTLAGLSNDAFDEAEDLLLALQQ